MTNPHGFKDDTSPAVNENRALILTSPDKNPWASPEYDSTIRLIPIVSCALTSTLTAIGIPIAVSVANVLTSVLLNENDIIDLSILPNIPAWHQVYALLPCHLTLHNKSLAMVRYRKI